MSPLLLIVMIVLLFASMGGGLYGHSRVGYAGWSPFGIIIVVFVILFLLGHIRFN